MKWKNNFEKNCLISFYWAHIFQISLNCLQCRLFVYFDEKQFLHLQKELQSFHWAQKWGIQPVKIYIFGLIVQHDYEIDCKKIVVFHPIIICRSNAKSYRIQTDLFFNRVCLEKIGCKRLKDSFLWQNFLFQDYFLCA